MAKRSRSKRKSSRARRARASEHGHDSLPDAAPYAPAPRSVSVSSANAFDAADSDGLGNLGDQPRGRGWRSWPLPVRVGLISFAVFAVVVVVMKFVSTL